MNLPTIIGKEKCIASRHQVSYCCERDLAFRTNEPPFQVSSVSVCRRGEISSRVTHSLYPAGYIHSQPPRTLRCTDGSIELHKEACPCWNCLEYRCCFACILP